MKTRGSFLAYRFSKCTLRGRHLEKEKSVSTAVEKECNSSSLDETLNKAYLSKTRGKYKVVCFPEGAYWLYVERNSVRRAGVARTDKGESGRQLTQRFWCRGGGAGDSGLASGWLVASAVLAKKAPSCSSVCSTRKTVSCSNEIVWELMSQSFCIYKHLHILREYSKYIFKRNIDFYIMGWR